MDSVTDFKCIPEKKFIVFVEYSIHALYFTVRILLLKKKNELVIQYIYIYFYYSIWKLTNSVNMKLSINKIMYYSLHWCCRDIFNVICLMLFEFDISLYRIFHWKSTFGIWQHWGGRKEVKIGSAMTFILRGQICFNVIDISRNDISITQIIHCSSAILCWRITGWTRKIHLIEWNNARVHKTYSCNSNIYQLPWFTSIHIWY